MPYLPRGAPPHHAPR